MELVISEFNDDIRQRILDNMNKEYLLTGKYLKDQRSISPKILSALMLSSGAAGTAVSATMSSSLFMATANPATLMSSWSRCWQCSYGRTRNSGTGTVYRCGEFYPCRRSVDGNAGIIYYRPATTV